MSLIVSYTLYCCHRCVKSFSFHKRLVLTWPSPSLINALTFVTKLFMMQLEVLLEALKIDYETCQFAEHRAPKEVGCIYEGSPAHSGYSGAGDQ